MDWRLSRVAPSAHGDDGGGAVDGGEAGGIVGLAGGEVEGAELGWWLRVSRSISSRSGGMTSDLAPAFFARIGKVVEHGCRRAVAFQQMEEGDGADTACPREPQPVRPLSP